MGLEITNILENMRIAKNEAMRRRAKKIERKNYKKLKYLLQVQRVNLHIKQKLIQI